MLVYVQPAIALVRTPVALISPRSPDGNSVKTHQKIIGIPDLGKGLFHLGDITDIPLSRTVPDTITWQDRAMDSRRPAVIIPGAYVCPVNPGSQLLQIVPQEAHRMFRFLC